MYGKKRHIALGGFPDLKRMCQEAHTFTINLYKISSTFPSEEKFGLTNQIRRASVSIESNLAEGAGRHSNKDFSRFLDIAQGSAFEVKCQILIARDLGYIDNNKSELLMDKINEVSRMITSLNQKLKTKN